MLRRYAGRPRPGGRLPAVICPKCGFGQPEGGSECLRCGVIFAKLRSRAAGKAASAGLGAAPSPEELPTAAGTVYTPAAAEPISTPPVAPRRLEPEGRRAVLVGAVLAIGVTLLPFVRFVLSYLGVLVHEIGHSVTAWLFGYPSVPAFDFTYGGGVSLHSERSLVVLLALVTGLVALLVSLRRHRRALAVVGGVAALWALVAATPLHDALIIAMGHGGELAFAGIFLYRALSGYGCRVPAERPLYGMVGWFLVLEGVRFAWGLVSDPGRRQLYADAKGGGHWMDFSRLSRDFLGVELEVVAASYLVAVVLTPLVTFVLFRHRDRLLDALARWLGDGWRSAL